MTAPDGRSDTLLSISGLAIEFARDDGTRSRAVDGIDLSVRRGEIACIVGESGSGKSVTALSLLRLIDSSGRITAGEIRVDGQDVLAMSKTELQRLRGGTVGMIFQEPMRSFHPLMTIGAQLVETLRSHLELSKREARHRALLWLQRAGLPDAERAFRAYPHELSGGMLQRSMIAMALCCEPELLVADEPTTALDVTVQAQILELLLQLRKETGLTILCITHDLGVVAEIADTVSVMHDGVIVEAAPVAELFDAPQHAKTKELLAARPVLAARGAEGRAATTPAGVGKPLVVARALTKSFATRGAEGGRSTTTAVDAVDLLVREHEFVGLVGESGSGKSTLGQTLLRLHRPSSGSVSFHGEDIAQLDQRSLRGLRPRMQLIFQDPYSSLNPRMRVGEAIAEPLIEHRIATRGTVDEAVATALERCGMPASSAHRYPHEFSGGQRQRIVIARAMALRPEFVVADEPVSALDVTTQAHVLELFRELQRDQRCAFLFISHDLAVVEQLCTRIAIMRAGSFVEVGSREQLFGDPRHPYTRQLLDAIPVADPRERGRSRVPPAPPAERQELVDVGDGHLVALGPQPGSRG